jgi:hypothetical protein
VALAVSVVFSSEHVMEQESSQTALQVPTLTSNLNGHLIGHSIDWTEQAGLKFYIRSGLTHSMVQSGSRRKQNA